MGLERNGAALFLKMRKDGVQFGRVVTLGHQNVHMELDEYNLALSRVGRPPVAALPEYADDFLISAGASQVQAMDFSSYEGASLVHDLNEPIPPAWQQQHDLVFDGGTLEHVFNFPVAIRNCMQMLRPGGRFLAVTMPNNWCGHGFYQFSPELFFRIFGPENGFSVVEMFVTGIWGGCHAVRDPAEVRSRVELCNDQPVFLLVHARRDKVCDVFARTPQQSDYVTEWSSSRGAPAGRQAQGWKFLPVIKQLRKLRKRFLHQRQLRDRSLDNRRFYTPVDLTI